MMTETYFDARVKQIEKGYHARREGADAYRDQELALLFVEAKASGRDQKWIAGRMGQAESWVSRRLLFGRFLTIAHGQFSGSPPDFVARCSERRFRDHWAKAGK